MKFLLVKKKRKNSLDFVLIFLLVLLILIGCVFVYSASFYSAELSYGDKFFFLKKQMMGVIIGAICFIFFYFFDYHKIEKFKWVFLVLSFVLLGLVFVPGIGITNYGATRWINLKFITLQPSEFAKFTFIVFASSSLSKRAENIKSFKGMLPVLFVGLVFCGLIIMEPNMSITICMAMLMVVMLFIGGARFKHFALLVIPAVVAVVVLIIIEPYRLRRLTAFVDPFASSKGEGFQLVQSLLGIALGGFFGTGIFHSRQKYLFLPFAESDFIFSIIAEETGFVGCVLVVTLFVLLFLRIIKIARSAPDKFGSMLASGISSIILIQVLMNIAVVTGSIPPTGLPLPFISAGSTSLVVFMSAIGVVLNINKQSKSRA